MADKRNHDELDLSGLGEHARAILRAEEESQRPARDPDPPPPVDWSSVRSVRGASILVRVALLLWVPFTALVLMASHSQRSLLERLAHDPTTVRWSELVADDHRVDLLNHAAIGMLAVTAVCWVVWFLLVYSNLEALRVAHRWTAGWAIGAWFVPFLCWWRPKQLADDAWEAVDRARRGQERTPTRLVLHAWWTTWVAASVVAILANAAGSSATDAATDGSVHDFVEASRRANSLFTTRAVLLLLAAVLACAVVTAISRAQAKPAAA